MITNIWINNGRDYTEALNIRETVFIKEQHCPIEIERDEYDKNATHLVLYDGKKAVGCGRIVKMENFYKLGRIAVLKEERGKHYGDLIVRLLLFKSVEMGASEIRIGAQIHASAFYARFGFKPYGKEYIEAGIDHIGMKVKAENVLYPSDCCS